MMVGMAMAFDVDKALHQAPFRMTTDGKTVDFIDNGLADQRDIGGIQIKVLVPNGNGGYVGEIVAETPYTKIIYGNPSIAGTDKHDEGQPGLDGSYTFSMKLNRVLPSGTVIYAMRGVGVYAKAVVP